MTFEQKAFSTLKINQLQKIVIKEHKKITNKNLFFIQKETLYNYVEYRLEIMKDTFEIQNFLPINQITTKTENFYGMIISIGNPKEEESLYLINYIDNSNSVPVKLNLKYCEKYSLFPGKIVAIKGKNVSGQEILVEDFYLPTNIEINDVEKSNLEKIKLDIISVSGPFYTEKDKFEALNRILSINADVLILHGPLIVLNDLGFCDISSFFKTEILPKLENWLKKDITSKIILLPSLDDLICFNVYPQSAYDFESTSRILFFGNPTTFSINDYLFCSTSTEIYLNLFKSELFCNKKYHIDDMFYDNDTQTRLSLQLLIQQSFLPTFPTDIPVELRYPEDLQIEVLPNFFILSSKTIPFYKQIQNSYVINHGKQIDPKYKYYSKITIKDEGDPVVTINKLE